MKNKLSKVREQSTLEQKVLRFIKKHRLVTGGEKLIVAVSGGPDSVCLLHILSKLQKELGIELHVAHLNHQLRGAESDADAACVADLAHRLGIPATVESSDVRAYQSRHRLSPEEAAREVRYSFLAQTAAEIGAARVAVGHTADDHVETIIMHLLRGSGTRGLRGLLPVSRWQSGDDSLVILRPLLELTREETSAYCRRHRLAPRTDTSNLSPEPFRNRIRHQLLPELRKYNPQVAEALLRTARIAADDLAFIDNEVARLWDKVAHAEKGSVVISKKEFSALPSALKRHLLRTAVESLLGNLKDIEAGHIEDIIDALDKPAGKVIGLPDGLNFTIEYDRYVLAPDAVSLCPFPVLEGETELNIPGRTGIPGWDIEAAVISPSAAKDADDKSSDLTACFDFDKTGNRLTVRRRRPGDRFQPLGMGQPKKLNEFMIDARIPRTWRRRIPIVCSPDQILWAVGYRIDERAKVTPNTKQVLRLKFTRI
ncbi:MAG: tRNA lysidine(34) synthetase TilS [Dehalococcoidales bacterium]|nr:tRNA lysidine(34) synthetase TilS [Dehalococcoidales bacterium]